MTDDLTVSLEATESGLAVRPAGELDMLTGPKLELSLGEAAERGHTVTLDLSAVTFIDASGLRVVLAAKERLGERLLVVAPSGQVRQVMAICRVDSILGLAQDPLPEPASATAAANVDFVRRLWAAFAAGGPEAVPPQLVDRVGWLPPDVADRPPRGVGNLAHFWRCRGAPPETAVAYGALSNDVLVRFELAAAGGGRREIWSLYLFTGTRLTHAVSFERREQAIEAHRRLRAA